MIQSSHLMVSSGNNTFLTCTNGNRCIGNIKVLKFYLVVGTYVDEMGWDGIEKDVSPWAAWALEATLKTQMSS